MFTSLVFTKAIEVSDEVMLHSKYVTGCVSLFHMVKYAFEEAAAEC